MRLHGKPFGQASPTGFCRARFEEKSSIGNLGEMRAHRGPGYRVYFTQKGDTFIILLCGADKRTQRRDIAAAKTLARNLEA
jgi:putative addiction module killer protein